MFLILIFILFTAVYVSSIYVTPTATLVILFAAALASNAFIIPAMGSLVITGVSIFCACCYAFHF